MDKSVIVSRKHPAEKQALAVRMRRRMTPAERVLWDHLRGKKLAGLHFRRQQIIDGFIADFYCHATRLVVEADGGVHQTGAAYDRERDEILATHSLHVLRFSNHEILMDTDNVLTAITTAARKRFPDFPV